MEFPQAPGLSRLGSDYGGGETVGSSHIVLQFKPQTVWEVHKCLHNVRVELCSAAALDFLTRVLHGKRFTIGPVGNHGIERIGHSENTGPLRDGLGLQAARVTCAVV